MTSYREAYPTQWLSHHDLMKNEQPNPVTVKIHDVTMQIVFDNLPRQNTRKYYCMDCWNDNGVKTEILSKDSKDLKFCPKCKSYLKLGTEKPVLTFETLEGKETQKRLPLNVTQCRILEKATGSEYIEKWVGTVVVLTPVETKNNKKTVDLTVKKPENKKLESVG